jgi:hypothetical protein
VGCRRVRSFGSIASDSTPASAVLSVEWCGACLHFVCTFRRDSGRRESSSLPLSRGGPAAALPAGARALSTSARRGMGEQTSGQRRSLVASAYRAHPRSGARGPIATPARQQARHSAWGHPPCLTAAANATKASASLRTDSQQARPQARILGELLTRLSALPPFSAIAAYAASAALSASCVLAFLHVRHSCPSTRRSSSLAPHPLAGSPIHRPSDLSR